MAIAPWAVLGEGKIRTDAEEQRRAESGELGRQLRGDWKRTPEERRVCLELEKVTKEVGAKNITSVAIAWVMQKAPYVFPIVGGRKVEHLHQNLEALDIHLTEEQIQRLDNIVPLNKGFPYKELVGVVLLCLVCGWGLTWTVCRAMARTTVTTTRPQGISRSGPKRLLSSLRPTRVQGACTSQWHKFLSLCRMC